MRRFIKKIPKGFTLLESLVTITLATFIMLGIFHSSFTALRANAQTEQVLDAENLIASAFAEFLSDTSSFPPPFQDERSIQTKSTTYTLSRSLVQDPGLQHCLKARVLVTWMQGRKSMSKEMECLLPFENPSPGGPL